MSRSTPAAFAALTTLAVPTRWCATSSSQSSGILVGRGGVHHHVGREVVERRRRPARGRRSCPRRRSSRSCGARLSRRPVAKLSMTRTSSPRASRRSARCEPMKPAPPVIKDLHARTSSRHACGTLPRGRGTCCCQSSRQSRPQILRPNLRLAVELVQSTLAIVDERAARAAALRRKHVEHELAHGPRCGEPLLERHREAHLVAAFDGSSGAAIGRTLS